MNEVELEELRRDREYEAKEDAEEEAQLHTDYYYARKTLIDCCLSDIRDDLQHLIVKMESYGWCLTLEELTDEIKDM